jgi:hypothetical protein
MPPPGIPNHNLTTPAQRLAYRKVQAELQARYGEIKPQPEMRREVAVIIQSPSPKPKPKPKPEIVPTIVVSDWTIDAQGCLTRIIGE